MLGFVIALLSLVVLVVVIINHRRAATESNELINQMINQHVSVIKYTHNDCYIDYKDMPLIDERP